MDFNTGQKARDVRQHAGQKTPPPSPQAMRRAMHEDRMKSLVGQPDLGQRTDSRVAFEDRCDVAAYGFEYQGYACSGLSGAPDAGPRRLRLIAACRDMI
jgi:hypothetical protein